MIIPNIRMRDDFAMQFALEVADFIYILIICYGHLVLVDGFNLLQIYLLKVWIVE